MSAEPVMTAPDILARWSRLLEGPSADEIGRDLVARWSEPHRHYHTLAHLDRVLSIVDSHAREATDADAVRLAAWFHDAVYDPLRTDNEDASAALAARVLPRAGVPAHTVAAVGRLVRLTASHDPAPADADGALLCDADLAVLAGDPGEYAEYTAAIRAEYAHVPESSFRHGRAAVLRKLCELPALYRLPSLREQWEERARANLAAELRSLES
jgi:predicted metal-dependent HD superfamily phosphohydrolase